MGTVTNISVHDLEVPLLDGRIVKSGETVEVHDDLLHEHGEECGGELIDTSTRENCDRHGFTWPAGTWTWEMSPEYAAGEEQRKAAWAEAHPEPVEESPPPETAPETPETPEVPPEGQE
jgi:hypothetical protein